MSRAAAMGCGRLNSVLSSPPGPLWYSGKVLALAKTDLQTVNKSTSSLPKADMITTTLRLSRCRALKESEKRRMICLLFVLREGTTKLKNFLWCELRLLSWGQHVLPPSPAAYL